MLAYFTGMICNYLLSRKYVFSSYNGATMGRTFTKFAFVALLGLVITTLVSMLALEIFLANSWGKEQWAKAAAHCLGIGAAFFVSFLGHNFLTFRETGVAKFMGSSRR